MRTGGQGAPSGPPRIWMVQRQGRGQGTVPAVQASEASEVVRHRRRLSQVCWHCTWGCDRMARLCRACSLPQPLQSGTGPTCTT